jgi:hypothetical protein
MMSLFREILNKDKTKKLETPKEIKLMFATMVTFALSVFIAVVFEFVVTSYQVGKTRDDLIKEWCGRVDPTSDQKKQRFTGVLYGFIFSLFFEQIPLAVVILYHTHTFVKKEETERKQS